MLNPDDFKQTIQTIDALGATPAVLAKVSELANDPDTELEDVCALLRNDGPLAADIIRIANSAYYAPLSPHGNLNSAVICIGLREVIVVVNLSLACRLFARDLAGYDISAYDYWSLSVSAALMMEALAKQTGLNREDAFTLGLLHPIGRLLINIVIRRKALDVHWDGQQPVEEWERKALGFDSAEAGALLLAHWHFPTATCEAIRKQFDLQSTTPPAWFLGALQFTRRILPLTGLNFEKQDWKLPEADPFVQATGLTNESAAEMVSLCREKFQAVLQAVGMDRIRKNDAANRMK